MDINCHGHTQIPSTATDSITPVNTRRHHNGARLCTMTRTNGELCNAIAVKGTVPGMCNKHGGQLPSVKAAAASRLREVWVELFEPELIWIATNREHPRQLDALRVAAQIVNVSELQATGVDTMTIEQVVAWPDRRW